MGYSLDIVVVNCVTLYWVHLHPCSHWAHSWSTKGGPGHTFKGDCVKNIKDGLPTYLKSWSWEYKVRLSTSSPMPVRKKLKTPHGNIYLCFCARGNRTGSYLDINMSVFLNVNVHKHVLQLTMWQLIKGCSQYSMESFDSCWIFGTIRSRLGKGSCILSWRGDVFFC